MFEYKIVILRYIYWGESPIFIFGQSQVFKCENDNNIDIKIYSTSNRQKRTTIYIDDSVLLGT
jgi:hypothetical protein